MGRPSRLVPDCLELVYLSWRGEVLFCQLKHYVLCLRWKIHHSEAVDSTALLTRYADQRTDVAGDLAGQELSQLTKHGLHG